MFMIFRTILNVVMWLIVTTVSLIVVYWLYVAELEGWIPIYVFILTSVLLRLTNTPGSKKS